MKLLSTGYKILRRPEVMALCKTRFSTPCYDVPFFPQATDTYIGWGQKKSGKKAIEKAKNKGKNCILLEDGFLRSLGLPHMNTPVLSLVWDDKGIYYDTQNPSRLNDLIKKRIKQSPVQRKEARRAIKFLTGNEISKYNHADPFDASLLKKNKKQNYLIIDQTYNDASIKGANADASDFKKMVMDGLKLAKTHNLYIKLHPETTHKRKGGYLSEILNNLPKKDRKKFTLIMQDCNPLSLLKHMNAVFTISSQMGFEALLLDKNVHCYGTPFYSGWGLTQDKKIFQNPKAKLEDIFAAMVFDYTFYYNPLTQQKSDFWECAELLKLWKKINEENKKITAGLFFTRWKIPFMKQYLWSTKGNPTFFKSGNKALEHAKNTNGKIAIWASKSTPKFEKKCSIKKIEIVKVEDGFLRSNDLGAKLVYPQSLCFDGSGIYYDAEKPSNLEEILNTKKFTASEKTRAKNLIKTIKKNNITKYKISGEASHTSTVKKSKNKTILVIGQVEGDASIIKGSKIQTNKEFLQIIRKKNKDATIIYKPHPDILAGVRHSATGENNGYKIADITNTTTPLTALFKTADEVHVNTSLAGLEALIHGKKVVCYGAPFYAGWGVTKDIYKYPAFKRRDKKRTLEEIIAASFIQYPRYLDFKSGLFTTPELLIQNKNPDMQKSKFSTLYTTTLQWKKKT